MCPTDPPFAALNVARARSRASIINAADGLEFLDFMNRMVKRYQGKEIHGILDNLSTHKPKQDMWLARHPNVHLHYTPTHASWTNQIEIWLSILTGKSLNGASFKTVAELKDHIDGNVNFMKIGKIYTLCAQRIRRQPKSLKILQKMAWHESCFHHSRGGLSSNVQS